MPSNTNPEQEPDLSAMLQEENEDFLKQLKRKHKGSNKAVHKEEEEKMSDDEPSDGEQAEDLGDPVESPSALKVYILGKIS